MSNKERLTSKVSPASKVLDLGEYRAERENNARRQELLEILKQMDKEADRNDAPILNETERCLDKR